MLLAICYLVFLEQFFLNTYSMMNTMLSSKIKRVGNIDVASRHICFSIGVRVDIKINVKLLSSGH